MSMFSPISTTKQQKQTLKPTSKNIRPLCKNGGSGLRVDPLGHVHYDGASDCSDDDDNSDEEGGGHGFRRGRSPSQQGEDLVGGSAGAAADSSHLGVSFTPAPYMRPKIIPPNSRARFAPPPVANATLSGVYEEDLLVLFGGAEEVKPTNETWLYHVEGKVWHLYDTQDPVSEDVEELRKARDLVAEVLPPPRSGHCAAVMHDVPENVELDATEMSAVGGNNAARSLGGMGGGEGGRRRRAANNNSSANVSKMDDSKITSALLSADDSVASLKAQAEQIERENLILTDYKPSVIVFGGADLHRGKYFNDLWRFDVQCQCWEELKPIGTAPSPRWQCTAAVMENRYFVFGGESAKFEVLNDLHMFDYGSNAWRKLRVVEPVPPPRMFHTAVTVGDKMIICGGIGSEQSKMSANSNYGSSSGDNSPTSESVAPPTITNSVNDTTDVWMLEMRTLLWRQLGVLDKQNSPFVSFATGATAAGGGLGAIQSLLQQQSGASISATTAGGSQQDAMASISTANLVQDSKVINGSIVLPSAISTGKFGRSQSTFGAIPLLPPGATISPLEGHAAVAFDNYMLIHGGRYANGKFNKNIHVLDIVAEKWHLIGQSPSHDNSTSPQVRSGHCSCAFVEKNLTATLDLASTLEDLDNARLHLSDETEMKPVFNAMITRLAAQMSFSGIQAFHGAKPILTRAVCGFVFGGTGYPRKFSDVWKIEFTDSAGQATEYEQITAAEANKRRDRLKVEAQLAVLGQQVDRVPSSPNAKGGSGDDDDAAANGGGMASPSRNRGGARGGPSGAAGGGRSPVNEFYLDNAEESTISMAEGFVFNRVVACPSTTSTQQGGNAGGDGSNGLVGNGSFAAGSRGSTRTLKKNAAASGSYEPTSGGSKSQVAQTPSHKNSSLKRR